MRYRSAFAACAMALAFLTSPVRAYDPVWHPSQCVKHEGQADCWEFVFPHGAKPFLDVSPCSERDDLYLALQQLGGTVGPTIDPKFTHLFEMPQQAGLLSAIFQNRVGQDLLACATGSQDRVNLTKLGLAYLALAAVWARAGGSRTLFLDYSQQFLIAQKNAVAAPLGTDSLEHAEYVLHLFCSLNDQKNGPSFADYGRMFVPDDFHKSGCDGYVYDDPYETIEGPRIAYRQAYLPFVILPTEYRI